MSALIRRVIHDPVMAATLDPEVAQTEIDEKPVMRRVIFWGLGDRVYRVAQPIGCWLDRRTAKLGVSMAWAKTRLCGCSACSKRRSGLNALVPDVRRWEGGWKVLCNAAAAALQRRFLGRV